jgi:hypothetical protein
VERRFSRTAALILCMAYNEIWLINISLVTVLSSKLLGKHEDPNLILIWLAASIGIIVFREFTPRKY